MISKTPYYSYCIGRLPKGCGLCVQGKKLVLFITGMCSRSCFYCPISDLKKGRDVVYANEWPVKSLKDAVTEARLCRSAGAGITGGDPLARLERAIAAIRLLKKEFGKGFHIHLYTSLALVTEGKLRKLEKAGLDEIRYHPEIENDRLWHRISIPTSMAKGVEIPVIPGMEKETKKLIAFINGKVDFLNLNELEISDTNANKLAELGYRTKDNISYAIKGSDAMAKRLLKYCEKLGFKSVHYCTARLKDAVQLVRRIRRRAKSVRKPYDRLTKGATLVRGAIYIKEPSFGYVKWCRTTPERKRLLKRLDSLRASLMKSHRIVPSLIEIDAVKLRLLTSEAIVRKIAVAIKKEGFYAYVVEDLPTYDEFEVESEEVS